MKNDEKEKKKKKLMATTHIGRYLQIRERYKGVERE